MSLDTQPLAGLRVLDLSRLLPGPYATLVLADLGADVIKIEAPEGGDYLRWMPPLTGKVSWAFFALNAGKRSVAIDLKKPGGAAALKALAAQADVLVETFRPGVMDRLGLGYAALAADNPRLIYCALTGYGQTGPYRDVAGHDLNYMALSGALGLGGPVDRPPQVLPVQVADISGSLWALVAILAALEARHTSGLGRFLDVSMTDGVTGFLTAGLAPHIGSGAAPPQRGNDVLTGGQACYGVYATGDGGFLAVAALEPKFWLTFCQLVARPEWVKRQFEPALKGEVAALLATRTRAEWEAVFAGTDACVEPVLAPSEVAAHPLHQARGMLIASEGHGQPSGPSAGGHGQPSGPSAGGHGQPSGPSAGGLTRIRTPTRHPDAPPAGKAPALGEHTRQVLAEAGLSDEQIEQLAAAGVIKP